MVRFRRQYILQLFNHTHSFHPAMANAKFLFYHKNEKRIRAEEESERGNTLTIG